MRISWRALKGRQNSVCPRFRSHRLTIAANGFSNKEVHAGNQNLKLLMKHQNACGQVTAQESS
jgi:hypothetical protein